MEQATSDLEWRNNPETDSDLKAVLDKAETEVMKVSADFRAEARQEIEDLRARLAVVSHLRYPPIEVRKNCCNEITILAQHLGDVMASYDCQLGTDVAYSLKDLVEMVPEANRALERAVEMHLLVLDNILKEGMCGDGGEAGKQIRDDLRWVCTRANIVDCPVEIDVIAI